MKRVIMGLAALALIGLTATVEPAAAGNLVFRAGGSIDPPSSAATRVLNDGTNQKYYTVDFPDNSDTCTLFHFNPFTDYGSPSEITGNIWYFHPGTCNTQTFSIQMALACVAPSSGNYDTVSFTNGTAFTLQASGTANLFRFGAFDSTALTETGCTNASGMILRVCRDGDGSAGTDSCAQTLKLVSVRATY